MRAYPANNSANPGFPEHRNRYPVSVMILAVAAVFAIAFCSGAQAGDDSRWFLQTSLYTTHFTPKPHHNNNQELLGVEYDVAPEDGLFLGGASFRNSFGQQSYYAYAGRRYEHDRWPLYAKLTAGVIRGYRGEHSDSPPLNVYGFAPVILPALGARAGQYSGELVVFGDAGMMINLGVAF
jgi:hypothetical protein